MPTSPVYATPEGTHPLPHSSHLLANPYSSVPVPITSAEYSSIQQRAVSGRQSGFATISRTPSIPNGDLIKSMEEEMGHSTTHTIQPRLESGNSMPARPVVSTFTSPQPSAFCKEDLQSFLIHKSQTSASTEDQTVISKGTVERTQAPTVQRRLSKQKPPPEIFNTSSESYGDIDFSGPNFSQKTSAKSHNHDNLQQQQQKQTPANSSSGETGKFPSMKKNIITNPNAIKKVNTSNGGYTPVKPSSSVSPNIGYFANGHYYDPNPIREPEADVYAPGSTLSDRSNVMSTFLGDGPLSRTPSSSDRSDDE